jgi:hypothetical protein
MLCVLCGGWAFCRSGCVLFHFVDLFAWAAAAGSIRGLYGGCWGRGIQQLVCIAGLCVVRRRKRRG